MIAANTPGNTLEGQSLQLDLEIGDDPVIRGFPMFVAATFRNTNRSMQFANLPILNGGLFSGPSTSTLEFRGPDGFAERTETLDPSVAGEADTFHLSAGQQRRFVFDMMLNIVDLPAGRYDVTLVVDGRGRSNAPIGRFRFTLIEPNAVDRGIRESWFHRPDGRPLLTWDDFLMAPFTPAPSDHLSEVAGRAVALYRFIHFAVYGPKAIADQDISGLLELEDHVAYPEFKVLQHEILLARKDQKATASLKAFVLTRWPGLAAEVERNEDGDGLLSSMRTRHGAESLQASSPNAARPYEPTR